MKSAAVGILLLVSALGQCPARHAPTNVNPASQDNAKAILVLPRKDNSVRFGVIGDTGRGRREQFEVGGQMAAFHEVFAFDFVIMLGDNIYGADSPADMKLKFEDPYKGLLDNGVKFYASLGNHDNPNQRFYKPFNMDGKRYYSFKGPKGPDKGEGSARFFAIDSNYLDKEQLQWLDKALGESEVDWKIPYFHHPLYSSGKLHGSSLETRAVLEPLFVKHGVSVVFAGHDHFYERIKPQKGGIVHWVSGAAGSLRKGNIAASSMTAKAFDTDYHFMIVEIVGDDLYFQAISRAGKTVDEGTVRRVGAPAAAKPPDPKPIPVEVPKVETPSRATPEGPGSPSPSPSPKPTPTPTPLPA
jgi:diadenosine tetraphosphatase ApaH/serine/threonine PP2A family protein phosphatase